MFPTRISSSLILQEQNIFLSITIQINFNNHVCKCFYAWVGACTQDYYAQREARLSINMLTFID